MKPSIAGVGINDANYNVCQTETIEGKQRIIWKCPFYTTWAQMINRCYNKNLKFKKPSYVGSETVPEWHYFMTFRSWMIEQDWEGKELDKDLLVPGNKVYGPETCVFISQSLNKFIIHSKGNKNGLPPGVAYKKTINKFVSQYYDKKNCKLYRIGVHDTAEDAHEAWLVFKVKQAIALGEKEKDKRIVEALILRYSNLLKPIEEM